MQLSCPEFGITLNNASSVQSSNMVCSFANVVMALPTALINLSLVFAIILTNGLTVPGQILLLNMALTDMLAGLLGMPGLAVIFLNIGHLKDPCHFAVFVIPFGIFLGFASFLTISMIAVERYLNIFYPFVHNAWVSPKSVSITTLLMWLSSVALILPSMDAKNRHLLVIFAASVTLLGAFVNSFCYISILWHAKKIRQRIDTEITRFGNNTQLTTNRDRSLLLAGCLIMLSIFFCHLPVMINAALNLFQYRSHFVDSLLCWSWTLVMVSSVINPTITCKFNPLVRQRLIKLWTCGRHGCSCR